MNWSQGEYSEALQSQRLGDLDEVLAAEMRFAFQPILNLDQDRVIGHEALVRGINGESAAKVIGAISARHRYRFDQTCRNQALRAAARAGLDGMLHLNCSRLTRATLYDSLHETWETAEHCGLDPQRVVLELSNLELLGDPRRLDEARKQMCAAGFKMLADNVGCGEVGLKRLAVFRPNFAKIDRSLVQNIDRCTRRQAILVGIHATCNTLGVELIAGGVETEAERDWLRGAGIHLGQGFLFAKPVVLGLGEAGID